MMSVHKTKYYISFPKIYGIYIPDVEFKLEDVQPYYDLWESGDITVYIEQEESHWLSRWFPRKEINAYRSRNIKVVKIEYPERRNCGKT